MDRLPNIGLLKVIKGLLKIIEEVLKVIKDLLKVIKHLLKVINWQKEGQPGEEGFLVMDGLPNIGLLKVIIGSNE